MIEKYPIELYLTEVCRSAIFVSDGCVLLKCCSVEQ